MSVRRTGIGGGDESGSGDGPGRPGPGPGTGPGIGGATSEDTAELGTMVPGPRQPGARSDAADGQNGQNGRRKPKPRKPLWRRIVVWTAASLAFLVAGVAVSGFLYIRHLNNNLTKDDLYLGDGEMEGSQPNADGQTPLNILLLGTDSRDGEENQDLGGARDLAGGDERADTQMLLHASADRSNMTLISIPRDTQVPIPRCTDPETGEVYPAEESSSINTSLSHGGPGCTVATWHELTGIPIDHFMMVDFAGVVDMADAVGGVPVCVDANVYDPESGLRLEEGETIVEGEEALQWLRTRHGFEVGSDVGRTRAQQMYLSNMVRELQADATLSNPGELMDLAEAATNALTVDHGIGTVNRLYDLGDDLRQVPNDRINMITMPWLPDPADPEVTVIPDPEQSEELFSMVREDIPLDEPSQNEPGQDGSGDSGSGSEEPGEPADPDDQIEVAVQNGTGYDGALPVDGRASEITDELHALGFTSAVTDETLASEESSAVLYPAEADRANAEAVAEALGLPGSAVRISPSATSVTLVVGADWREGTSYPEEQESGDDGGSGGGGGSSFDNDEIISGDDENNCMHVNPYYTW
jgi:LCP family protein required for cell wall assembly